MLSHDIPIMKDFPIIPLKVDDSDKQLPPLAWQSFIAKRMVTHYLTVGQWISHLIKLARYGEIPLCNLEGHDPRFLIDVAYARRLQQERIVLWWSSGPKPDHAGYEKDDVLSPLEIVDMPSINSPGTYSSVCVDLSVGNLTINTILASSLINEAEGSDSISFNPAAASTDGSAESDSLVIHSDNAFATAGILVLRELVKSWWGEACANNDMADVMVQHLVRWVENPGSFLYDRSLHYYVQMMSRKALQQLMTDFRRVGSNVVYASAHRLLLQTTKAEVGNAYAYSQYILKTVKAKPLFTFLELEIKEYWDYLVWYDAFNYGGKGCTEVVGADEQQLDCVMNWQFATFLPAILQPVFEEWVIAFIELMHGRKRPTITNADGSVAPRLTQIAFKSMTEIDEPVDLDDPEKGLPKTFTKPLIKQISSLLRRQQTEVLHAELEGDWQFPSLPGSHLTNMSNPVLQLLKSLTQVLSLDKGLNLPARQLRAQLLNLFEIREFSAAASFHNPSASVVISGLVCDECCSVRDLDLCRDADILPPSTSSLDGAAAQQLATQTKWRCLTCSTPFDRLRIEEKLVARVQSYVMSWASQDLKCAKCLRLRGSNEFAEHCGCSGVWVCTVDRDNIMRRLAELGRIAEWYGLGMLERCVREVEEGI
jgi:DNA polymerase epsilon subunit 1